MAQAEGLVVVGRDRKDDVAGRTMEDVAQTFTERVAGMEDILAARVLATTRDVALVAVTARSGRSFSRVAGPNVRDLFRTVAPRTITQFSRDHGSAFGEAARMWESARASRESAVAHA